MSHGFGAERPPRGVAGTAAGGRGGGPVTDEDRSGLDEDGLAATWAAIDSYEQDELRALIGLRRRRATIQLASSLRNLGAADEAVALLSTELSAPVDGEAAALEDAV